jgi:hypothetical protein
MSNPNQTKVSQVRESDDVYSAADILEIIAAFRKADPARRQRALDFLRQAAAEQEESRS